LNPELRIWVKGFRFRVKGSGGRDNGFRVHFRVRV
jgi:hypothetical protein